MSADIRSATTMLRSPVSKTGALTVAVTLLGAGYAALATRTASRADPIETVVVTADGTRLSLIAEGHRRAALMRDLVDDLAAGRRTLHDAAAVYAAQRDGYPKSLLTEWMNPSPPVGRRDCVVVLTHVGVALRDDPRRDAVLARLRAELDGSR